MWSETRRDVKKRAKVGWNKWQCEQCGCVTDKIDIDHVSPIGPTPGSRVAKEDTTWDSMINNMFCDADNLRALCKKCHNKKGRKSCSTGKKKKTK